MTHSRVLSPIVTYSARWLAEACIGARADVTAMLQWWGVGEMVRGRDETGDPAVEDCDSLGDAGVVGDVACLREVW